jgi:hypothetical protein
MMLRAFRILLLCGLLGTASPARAEPISASLGLVALLFNTGLFASVGAAIWTANALVTGVILVGLHFASGLLNKPAAGDASSLPASGTDLQLQYGGDVPRAALLGLCGVKGQLIYANTYGANNNRLQAIFQLSDGGPCEGINRLWYNGKLAEIVPDTGTQAIAAGDTIAAYNPTTAQLGAGGEPSVYLRFFRGDYDQEADAELVTHANPSGRWTEQHRGRGICYLSVTQCYDEPNQLTGIPDILVELKGLREYDVRKDSTAGGSGAHRWGQPATYEWSDNPAIHDYNYRRGFYVNAQRLVGMGASAADLIRPLYVSAANACDEAVALAAGGSEKRYRCGMVATCERQHSENLDVMRASAAGYSFERAGQFGFIAGVAQLPQDTFTDDDFIVGQPFSFSKYRTRTEVATAVHGSFADPDQMWESVPFPPRLNAADDAAMGERLDFVVDLTQVYSSSQAQRIAEIERRRRMHQRNGTAPLKPRFRSVKPGQWLTYNSAAHGTFDVLVKTAQLSADHTYVTITYDEAAASIYSWISGDNEEPMPPPPTPGEPGTRIVTVPDFDVFTAQVPAAGGLTHPALGTSWTPIADPAVDRLVFEYRVATPDDSAEVLRFIAATPGQGLALITPGVQADTVYDVRGIIETTPQRAVEWTDWEPVTSGAAHVVPTARGVVPGGIPRESLTAAIQLSIDKIDPALRAAMLAATGVDVGRLSDAVSSLVAQIMRDRDDEAIQLERHRDEIHIKANGIAADVVNEISARQTALGVEAAARLSMQAIVDSNTAGLVNEALVRSAADSAEAALRVALQAVVNSNTAAIASNTTAIATETDARTAAFLGLSSTVNGHTASIASLFSTDASITGKLTSTWQVQLNAAGKVSGLKAYNDGSVSVFAIETDIFTIGKSGAGGTGFTQVFTVQTIDGAQVMLMNGAFYVQSIIADTVQTKHLITDAATAIGYSTAADANIYLFGTYKTTIWDAAPYAAGTAGVTHDATAVTHSGSADWDTYLADAVSETQFGPNGTYASGVKQQIKFAGDAAWRDAVFSGTSELFLVSPYTGSTNGAISYQLRKRIGWNTVGQTQFGQSLGSVTLDCTKGRVVVMMTANFDAFLATYTQPGQVATYHPTIRLLVDGVVVEERTVEPGIRFLYGSATPNVRADWTLMNSAVINVQTNVSVGAHVFGFDILSPVIATLLAVPGDPNPVPSFWNTTDYWRSVKPTEVIMESRR